MSTPPKPYSNLNTVGHLRKTPTLREQLSKHLNDYGWAAGQYRAGVPLREISDQTGIPRGKLFDYFSTNGISRDMSEEVRNRTNVLLAEDYVDMNQAVHTSDPEQIININATLQAALIREHRQDIRRMRKLCMGLLEELESVTNHMDWFNDLGAILRAEDDKGVDRMNDIYQKVISTPGRTDNLKKLGETLKIMVALERQAFGMREDFEDGEIRKGKLAAITPVDEGGEADDYTKITRRFMAVLGMTVEDANVVSEAPGTAGAD